MSTKLEAQRKLHRHGQKGNWRFKGLLLAALPGSGVTSDDVAEAWPDPGKKSDYRFLSQNPTRDPEADRTRRVIGEKGTDRHRILSDYAEKESKELGDGTLGADLDSAIKRTLFSASTYEEVDTLFREQLLETIMEGAAPRQIARDASNVINADTRRGDIPVGQDQTYAPAVGEGAEIRDDQEEYATISWDATKYGQGARITDEMVDHAMVDIIERQIQYLGASVENSINRVWLNTMLESANGNFDTAGSDQGVPALNGAVGTIDEEDFMPDSFISHPEFRTTLFDDSNLVYVNQSGSETELRERELNRVMGVDHFAMSGGTYDGTAETWGYDADGEKGSVVYDSNHSHLILYSPNGQDIEVKDYDDPIRDLRGVNARIHCDADVSQERALATVEY